MDKTSQPFFFLLAGVSACIIEGVTDEGYKIRSKNFKDQKSFEAYLSRNYVRGLHPEGRPDEIIDEITALDKDEIYRMAPVKSLQDLFDKARVESLALEREVQECVLKQGGSYYGKLSVRDDLRKVKVPGAKHNKQLLQEWDGVLVSDKTIILIEAKHSPSSEDVTESLRKKDVFDALLKEGKISFCTGDVPGDAEEKLRLPCTENSSCKCRSMETDLIVGGLLFHDNVQRMCKKKGIRIVRVSGERFCLN